MKKLFYMLFAALLLCSCYDDKGNYDYRTLGEVEISIPQEVYSVGFGEPLRIPATVETDIPEEDLRYMWEVSGDTIDTYWEQFIAIYEGKDLDYVCNLGDVLFPRENTYDFRLNVTQISTDRHFYSDVVEVTLIAEPSICGAMVLHGDGTSCDIGLIEADEFQLTAPASPLTPRVFPHYYSESNSGAKLDGVGQRVMQFYTGNNSYPDYIVVVAWTDQNSTVTESKNMRKTGEWNDLFAGGLNQGIPQFEVVNSSDIFVIDGGDIFAKQYLHSSFTTPCFVARDYEYDFFPAAWIPSGGTGILFDQASQGFIKAYNFMGMKGMGSIYPMTMETSGSAFNLADMDAEMIYMDWGGSAANRHVAVMRDNSGEYFFAEMDFTDWSNENIPKYKYDLSSMSDAQSGRVTHWAFGTNYMNMGYYATSTGVYNFTFDAGSISNLNPLRLMTGEEIQFEGEITHMEILKSLTRDIYHKYNVEMVVGTYGGSSGSGKLYSIELDPNSGRAVSVKEYEGFDRIYDLDIKAY